MHLFKTWGKRRIADIFSVFVVVVVLMCSATYSTAANVDISAATMSGLARYSDGKIFAPKGVLTDAVSIEAGHSNVFVVKSDGTVWAWGSNSVGELGDGPDSSGRRYPVQLRGAGGVGYLTNVIAVSSYFWSSFALKSDGTVWAWGSNSGNKLWVGDEVYGVNYPKQVLGPNGIGYLTNVTAIAAGDWINAALKSDGTVWAWGSGRTLATVITNMGTPLQNVSAISSGGHHSVGLKSDGTVWTWGTNITVGGGGGGTTYYPTGHTTNVAYARQVGDINNVVAIAATAYHSFALRSDGTVLAWGDTTNPTQLAEFTDVVALSRGQYYLLALKSDGKICRYNPVTKTTDTYPSAPSFTGIVQGDNNSYALSGSSMYGWGWNDSDYYPLLLPAETDYPEPTLMDTSSRGTAILPAITADYLLSITPDVTVGPDSHVSFYFRSSGGQWKKRNGSVWETATFDDTATGNTAEEVASITAAGWAALPSNNVEIGVVLRNSASVPGAFLNSVSYSTATMSTLSLSGGAAASIGATNDYQAFVDVSGGTVVYEWTITKGSTSSTASTASVTFNETGNATVAVKAHLAEYPDLYRTASKSVTVSYEAPTITSVTCPSALQMGEIAQCTIEATAPGGTIAYRWASPGGVFSANEAITDVYFTNGGSKVITAQAYIVESPLSLSSSYALVEVAPISMSFTATCPEGGAKVTPFTCTATGESDWGTVKYSWTADTEGLLLQSQNEGAATFVAGLTGQQNVVAKMYLLERPHLFIEKTLSISITLQPPEIIEAACIEAVVVGEPVVCNVNAIASEGTVKYIWSVSGDNDFVIEDRAEEATVQFKTPGEKTIKIMAYLEEYEAAFTEQTFTVTVQGNPVAVEINCPENAVTKVDATCSASANVAWGTLKYKWEVPDGKFTEIPPGDSGTINFSREGTMTVKITASLEEAPFITGSASANIKVVGGSQVTPTITGPRYVYIDMPAVLTATAPCMETEKCTIKWNINGKEKTGASVEIVFNSPGKNIITAEATLNDGGGSKSAQHIVYVEALPKPMFNITGPSAIFEGRETTYAVEVNSRHKILPIKGEWTLPDGSKSSEETLTMEATNGGKFIIKYTAWVDGYRETTERTVARTITAVAYVFPAPKINVKTTEGNAPLRVTLGTVNTYRPVSGAYYGMVYNWDFGDGETLTTDKPSVAHTFQKIGQYTVSMFATDPVGNTSSDQVVISATSPPIELALKLSKSNEASRVPLTVYARSSITKRTPLDRLESYEWKVNDVVQEGTQPEYFRATYNTPGDYTITYKVLMKSGATTEKSIGITVNPNMPPECAVEYTDDPKNKYITYKAICTDTDGRLSAFKWDLDDGRGYRSGFTRISAKAAESRTYNIKLQATDDAGGVTEVIKEVVVVR